MEFNIRKYEVALEKLYGSAPSVIEKQSKRYHSLVQKHLERFDENELHLFSTPGRTELSGNHTDHNHGRVIAASVNMDSIAVAGKNSNNEIILYSEGYDNPFVVDLNDVSVNETEQGTTTALVRGIAARFKELGAGIGGLNISMSSEVLPGSGLSSSASVEVLIGTILNTLYNEHQYSMEELAKIGQHAENVFFGKPCGLMDQTACAVGGIITIDFKYPEKPIVKKVDFDFSKQNYSVLVVDTGGNHADLTDDYASVPAEMKSVAAAMGCEVLRDVSEDKFIAQIPELRKHQGDRSVLRSMHYFQENKRVIDQVKALEAGDFPKFLAIVKASGNSSFKWLQNVYTTNNVDEQSVTLALALTEKFLSKIEAGACRVHGGGFAGTIQVFLPNDAVDNYVQFIESIFGEKSALVLKIRPFGTIHLNTFI